MGVSSDCVRCAHGAVCPPTPPTHPPTAPAQHQVYIKSSALFRVSSEAYPYLDACRALRLLVDTFGAQRIMWGTDSPWVTEKMT